MRMSCSVYVVGWLLLTACGSSNRDLVETSSASATAGNNASSGPKDSDTQGPAEDTDDQRYDVGPGVDIGFPPGDIPDCGSLADDEATSLGCEFWSVRVPLYGNPLGPDTFGIGVGNPFDEEVAITVEDLRGPGGALRTIQQFQLAPQQSVLVTLEGPGGVLPMEDHTAASAGLTEAAAFRITSDQPVTAMQIAPVGGALSYTPEASMLLPTRALNNVYYGLGYEAYTIPLPLQDFAGWVLAVAVEDDTTITTVEGEQTLNAFDTWTFDPDDPTGFFISADKRIAVFGGTNCSNVPADNPWCDHVEEQLIPVAAWGTRYVGARHPVRTAGTPETVYWRVVAARDETVIDLTPGSTIHLAKAGDYQDFNTSESFLAESDEDHPFMLVQYMGGGAALFPDEECYLLSGGGPTGDPYMMQMVPTDQWLPNLPFLTDDSYARDFVTIMRPAGASVTLDCMGSIPDDRFEPIVGTQFEVANIMLDYDGLGGEGSCVDGQQFISASEPVGVSVGGYDCAASYGYPGGMSLDALWVPPDIPPEG